MQEEKPQSLEQQPAVYQTLGDTGRENTSWKFMLLNWSSGDSSIAKDGKEQKS